MKKIFILLIPIFWFSSMVPLRALEDLSIADGDLVEIDRLMDESTSDASVAAAGRSGLENQLRDAGASEGFVKRSMKQKYAPKESKSWFSLGTMKKGLTSLVMMGLLFAGYKMYSTVGTEAGRNALVDQMSERATAKMKETLFADERLKPLIEEEAQNALVDRLTEKFMKKALENPQIQQFTNEEQRKQIVAGMVDEMLDAVRLSELSAEQKGQFTELKQKLVQAQEAFKGVDEAGKAGAQQVLKEAQKALVEFREQHGLSTVVASNATRAFEERINMHEKGKEFARGVASTGIMGALGAWWNG